MLKQLINFYKVSSPRPCNGEALSSSDSQHLHSDARRLKYLKWSTFLSATFGYGMYYVCRLSLNVVKKPIVDEGIFSETELGIIGSVLFFTYALGKFTNGFLADRSNINRFMTTGLLVTALVNLCLGFTNSFLLFAILWGISGWFQSMGAASCVVGLSRWFTDKERGSYYGFWSASHNIGEALTFLIIASIVSVLTFNFFFTEPRFSLHAYDSGYPVTFLVMFLASLITGSLASKLKSHAKRSAQVAWRTKLLFETDQNLQKAGNQEEIISVTARQLLKIFQRDIVAYRVQQEELMGPEVFLLDQTTPTDSYTTQKGQEVARWVLTNNKRAGAGTETLSDACCTYLSVRTGKQVYGVVGIAASDKPLDSFETSILFSVLGECALALENQKNLEEKEAAAVLAKNEQLRANLLRSISHDLRTPLTSISGNANNLLSNGNLFDTKTKEQMYTDIYDDAMWLINLVENLLSVSRLEEGRMNLHVSTELMDEIVAEALRHINRKSVEYHLNVQSSEEYLLVQVDAKLIIQVIINIVDNAIKYTPPGSEIDIGWRKQGNFVYVSVSDNGPGIPDQAKPHIFDMFYSVSNQIADSRRSMGLGLALCKSIINAHGGEITVTDQLPHGSIFTFSVPAGEVELHE